VITAQNSLVLLLSRWLLPAVLCVLLDCKSIRRRLMVASLQTLRSPGWFV